MTYAEHRRIIDVDSHLIELDDFLHNAARPEHLGLVPSMHDQVSLEGLTSLVLAAFKQIESAPGRVRPRASPPDR